MEQVSVALKDLQKLIDRSFEQEVRQRAEIIVLQQPGMSNAEAAFEFASRVHEAEPEARKAVELRYRSLREALKNGENVAAALSAFIS